MSHQKPLAVDIGTSALKAVLFGGRGEIQAMASRPISTRSGGDRSHEQAPEDWWAALADARRELGVENVSHVVFTGSMQNLIALDRCGRPLAPAVLYSDRRLEDNEIAGLAAKLPADYARRTGNKLDPAHTILKLMCLDRFVPAAARRRDICWTFGAKDAVTFRLTGRAAIDPTTASTTGLMDIAARRWDDELLALAGLDEAALPQILPADAIVGEVTPEAARQTGLPAGIPVLNGAGDAAAATWGAFADAPGAAYCYLGTTGWVAATLEMEDAAPPRDIYTLADPIRASRAIVISPFLTAGAAMDWLCELTGQPVAALLEAADAEDCTGGAPLFLPYLNGERAPFEDSHVRGAFLGLDRSHSAGALVHAVMEGVAFAVRHNLETAGLPPTPLTVIGGAAQHPVQRQLLADALGREITAPEDSQEMAALGVLRMVAGKIGIGLTDAEIGTAVVAPRAGRSARHDRRYAAYLAASRFAREQARSLE